MTTLKDLAAMLDAATGASREIDVAAFQALFPDTRVYEAHCPPLTSSIDAALSLVGRLLPGWDWALQKTGKVSTCWLNPPGTHLGRTIHAPTAPLAILRSLVAALIAQENDR